jgi:hypothetical protein
LLFNKLLTVYAFLFFGLYGIAITSSYVDSAYLRARYSQNLQNGDGFVYNPNEPILLTSAPLVVITHTLLSIPEGEIEAPPALSILLLMVTAIHFLIRIFLYYDFKLFTAFCMAVWIAIPSLVVIGGIELWLATLSLIAIDLAQQDRWRWAGLVAGLTLLVAPLGIIFVLLLGIKSRKEYWQLVWIPVVAWYGFALVYFGAEGLRGLTLPSASGEGFLGVYSPLILIPLVVWMPASLRRLPPHMLMLVIWGLAYSLAGVLFKLSDDATLLVLSITILAAFMIKGVNRNSPLLPLNFMGFILLALLLNRSHPDMLRQLAVPTFNSNGSIGHYGDNREAFWLENTVYQLDGKRDPHLRELVEQGDRVGAILATAPDYLLMDAFPEDSTLGLLEYEPTEEMIFMRGDPLDTPIFQRGQPVFDWQEPQSANIDFGSDLHLTSITQDRTHIETDGILRLRLDWERDPNHRPIERLEFVFNLLDYQGVSYGSVRQIFPLEKWEPAEVTTYHVIPVNEDAGFGRYDILLAIGYQAGTIDQQIIGSVKIPVPSDDNSSEEPLAHFDDGSQSADLMSATIGQSTGQLSVNLVWRGGSRFDADYIIFVHLTPPDDPIPLAQADAPPLNGRYPTSIWESGDLISDSYTLDITSLPPGEYVIRVGLFHPERGRIPTGNGDSVIVGEITK